MNVDDGDDRALLDDDDLQGGGSRAAERFSAQEKQLQELMGEFGGALLFDGAFGGEVSSIVAACEEASRQQQSRRRRPAALPPSTSGYTRSQSSGFSSLVSSDEEGADGEDAAPASPPRKAGAQALTPFWSSIAPYIRELTEADLQLLMPTALPEEDPIWGLPPLMGAAAQQQQHRPIPTSSTSSGDAPQNAPRHVTSTGQTSLSSHLHPQPTPSSSLPAGGVAEDNGEEFLPCGDLTERILSALVEEHLLHKSTKQGSRGPSFNPTTDLPLLKPPIPNYAQATMLSLEERIKLELKAIGLFGPPLSQSSAMPDTVREDDEISSEIRSLQSQLRDQIRINNERKYQLYQLSQKAMQAQDKERIFRALDTDLERIYQSAAASEKRSKSRKRRH